MPNTDIQIFYNYWCDGSCYHVSKTDNWMGMGVFCLETNTVFPRPVPRKMAISGPRGDHNIAEYLAVLCALTDLYIIEGTIRTTSPHAIENRTATFHSDSQLVIRQINGQYQAKKKSMKLLLGEVQNLVLLLNSMGIDVVFKWNPREAKNQKIADWLSKVGNRYFTDYEPDDTINHGIGYINEWLLPRAYETIRRGLKWPPEECFPENNPIP